MKDRYREYVFPLTLEEQLIVKIIGIVGPSLSISATERNTELFAAIEQSVNSYAQAKENEIYESREDNVSSDKDVSGLSD